MYKVDNAVIMAAGTSSRFAPLSYEIPKALIKVKNEVLIERQIEQLKQAGIDDIYIVVGYKSEQFEYLKEKYNVSLVRNDEYLVRNNNASIYAVKDILSNTYICSADNYFSENPFESEVEDSYYAAVYSKGETKEWCLEYDENDIIRNVTVGGRDVWFMLGHAFWNEEFSRKFIEILENEYNLPQTPDLLWEGVYKNHIDELKMKIRKYDENIIFEFDTIDELRGFDVSYIDDTRSVIIKSIVKQFECAERDITNITAYKETNTAAEGFKFTYKNKNYVYSYREKVVEELV